MLHMVESDNPFDAVFLEFWEPGDIPDRYGYLKILTCLDCMTGFEIGVASELKEITPEQVVRWDFGNLFVPFGLPKMIVVDADEMFYGIFRKTFRGTLLIPVHAVTRGNHKVIINEGFHRYLNKPQNINSSDK